MISFKITKNAPLVEHLTCKENNMAKEVQMINVTTGAQVKSFEGFSWTMLFFGSFAPLIRGDMKMALISFVATVCTMGISWLVFPFLWNKYHKEALVRQGFVTMQEYEFKKQQDEERRQRERKEDREFFMQMKG